MRFLWLLFLFTPAAFCSGYGRPSSSVYGGGMNGHGFLERGVDIRLSINDLEQQLIIIQQQRNILKEQARLIEFQLDQLHDRLSRTMRTAWSPPPPNPPPSVPLPPVPQVPVYKNKKASASEVAVGSRRQNEPLEQIQEKQRWFERPMRMRGGFLSRQS